MNYFQLPEGNVACFDNAADAPPGAVAITAEQFAQVARTPVITPEMAQAQIRAAAQAQLDVVTGPRGQFMRASVAGVVPTDARLAPWQTYVIALRAISNGTDTTSTTLPTQPAYIEGT